MIIRFKIGFLCSEENVLAKNNFSGSMIFPHSKLIDAEFSSSGIIYYFYFLLDFQKLKKK